jgi:hypothetical protein
MFQSDSILWFHVCPSTRGQLRLQEHMQKLYKDESVKNSSTEGDFPGLGTDYPDSNEKNADQKGKGPNGQEVTATKSKEGNSANFEQSEDTLDNGQADEIIFASKEQSPLLARYMQKVRTL